MDDRTLDEFLESLYEGPEARPVYNEELFLAAMQQRLEEEPQTGRYVWVPEDAYHAIRQEIRRGRIIRGAVFLACLVIVSGLILFVVVKF